MIGEVTNKVSIVVPVYNAEKTLVRCIESIVTQTYKEWELWLINDGSSDASGVICESYSECDVRVRVVHKKNEGVSVTRNIGIEKATGEYVMFIDSDDYLEQNALELMMGAIDRYDTDVVMCGFFYHEEEDGMETPNHIEDVFVGDNERFVSEIFREVFEKELLNPPWNKVIRKSVLENNKIGFAVSYSICEDMIFTIDVLRSCEKIVFLNSSLYHYIYKKGDNLVNRFHDNYFEALSAYYNVVRAYLEKNNAFGECREYINSFFVEKTIAFFKKIYSCDVYSRAKKYSELKRICKDETFRSAIDGYKARKPKKRVVKVCIKYKMIYLLHLLYLGLGETQIRT